MEKGEKKKVGYLGGAGVTNREADADWLERHGPIKIDRRTPPQASPTRPKRRDGPKYIFFFYFHQQKKRDKIEKISDFF